MVKLYKHLKIYTLLLVLIYVLVLSINKVFGSNFNDTTYIISFINVFIYTTSIYLANTFFVGQFFKTVSISDSNFKIALGYHVAIISAIITAVYIEFLIGIFIHDLDKNQIFNRLFSNKHLANYLLIFFITTFVYFLLVYKSKQENKLREHKIVAHTASAKFETLKSQIDPHFLFNSLNVLSSLIEENPEKAQEFTIALSKTYRYVLEQRNKDLIDLNEELQFAKTFVKLLKLRFEDALEIILPSEFLNSEAKVVPLVLQLLLENAVKHNVINSQNKLIIEVIIQNDTLKVTNTYQPKNTLTNDSTGFGLNHIIKQYQMVTDRKVLIEKEENSFTVYIPILTQQITTEVQQNFSLNSEEIILKRAKERLKELKKFYVSIFTFAIFTSVYLVLELFKIKNSMTFWMPIAIVIYAFTLVIQAVTIFGLRNWENKMINKLMNQYKQK